MTNLLIQGLLITAIGMGLVFGALAALWGIMALMSRLLSPRPRREMATAGADDLVIQASPTGPVPTDEEMAAIAAALALLCAEKEAEAAIPWRLPPLLTRWVAVGFGRQLHSWQPRRTKRDA